MPEPADLYEILQVHPAAHPEVIQSAYRRLVHIYHPDRNSSPDAPALMVEINRAYAVLNDPQQRAAYDRQRASQSSGMGSQRAGQSSGMGNQRAGGGSGMGSQHAGGGSGMGSQHAGGGSGMSSQHAGGGSGMSSPRAGETNRTGGGSAPVPKVNIGKSVLDGWYRKQGLIQRLFAPSGFLNDAECVEAEDFTCRRATTDFLTFSVSETVKELTLADRMKYSNDLRLLDYRPKEFKTETVQVVVNERQVNCSSCSGQGRNPCPPSVQCGNCSGAGSFPCYPEMPCPSCTGTRRVPCRVCQGTGQRSSFEVHNPGGPCTRCRGRASFRCGTCLNRAGTPIGRVTCNQCMGSGRKRCEWCNERGQLVCRDCNGRGYVLCDRCNASGTVVYAGMVTHTFTPRSSTQFLPQNGNPDGLKNGITAGHLARIPGKVVRDEYQRPGRQDDVLQKLTVVDFEVSSYQFRYRGKPFIFNHLKDANGRVTEFVTAKLPLSAKKVAIASGIGVLAWGIAIGTAALFGY